MSRSLATGTPRWGPAVDRLTGARSSDALFPGYSALRCQWWRTPTGTLWIDVKDLSEVDAVRERLTQLGVPVTCPVPDPDCDLAVEEVDWGELYPRIVPRNGPEPGIIVQPTEIPEGHTLLLATQTMPAPRPGHHPKVVQVLRLIRGPAPTRVGGPRLYPARPPGELAGQLRAAIDRITDLEARVSALENG